MRVYLVGRLRESLIFKKHYFFGNKYWVTTRNNPSTFNVVVVIRATKTVSESLYQPLPVAMIIQMWIQELLFEYP